MSREKILMAYYDAMLAELGPSRWWPGDSPFEIALGAILTQNTAWKNVEKALALVKAANAMSPLALWRMTDEKLEACLHPSGFYRMKAQRVRAFLRFLAELEGAGEPSDDASLSCLAHYETAFLRESLLAVKGIGPETADSILLYAADRPTFVVDAYTRRLMTRHGFLPEEVDYDELQAFLADVLPVDVPLYNEYHALIVRVGNTWCKKTKPKCAECPLGKFLEYDSLPE